MQHFNYTDSLDSTPTLTHNSQGSRMLQGIVENISDGSDARLKLINSDEGNNSPSKIISILVAKNQATISGLKYL